MQLSLRRGEKLFLNGAVIRADRRVCVELLNDATFLLENHVMQPEQAFTPLRQLYFNIQLLLLEPSQTSSAREQVRAGLSQIRGILASDETREALDVVDSLLIANKSFAALKRVRALIAAEDAMTDAAPPAQKQKVYA